MYGPALVALARRGKVPGVALGHLAVRVLLFLLGQRPGYFAHQKVIAAAVESNLTSVRSALAELRTAGLVSWELIPPHHPLPTGSYTQTNVNRYYVDASALLSAFDGADAAPPRTMAPTHRNSDAYTGTDLRFEIDPPLPPNDQLRPRRTANGMEGMLQFSKRQQPKPPPAEPRRGAGVAHAARSQPHDGELEKVLTAWRTLGLSEPDDRSVRALRNRLAEGATFKQLAAAVEGAKHDEWLQKGHAQAPFAVVFASLESVVRFAAAGQDYARRLQAAARRRVAERRAACALLTASPAGPSDNAELAALALKKVLGLRAAPESVTLR